jgi:hypothetical protein
MKRYNGAGNLSISPPPLRAGAGRRRVPCAVSGTLSSPKLTLCRPRRTRRLGMGRTTPIRLRPTPTTDRAGLTPQLASAMRPLPPATADRAVLEAAMPASAFVAIRLQILTSREPIVSIACSADWRADPWRNDTPRGLANSRATTRPGDAAACESYLEEACRGSAESARDRARKAACPSTRRCYASRPGWPS